MPTGTFEFRNDAERVAMEQALAFVSQMHDLALAAPAGQVLDQCEGHVLGRGRDFLRAALGQAVQSRADEAEAKKGRPAPARAGAGSASSGGASGR